jgi:uncharacterized protein (DUF2126 family)
VELLLHSTMCLNDLHSSDNFTVRTGDISLAEHSNTTQSCYFLIFYHVTVGAVSSLVINFVVQPMRLQVGHTATSLESVFFSRHFIFVGGRIRCKI